MEDTGKWVEVYHNEWVTRVGWFRLFIYAAANGWIGEVTDSEGKFRFTRIWGPDRDDVREHLYAAVMTGMEATNSALESVKRGTGCDR